MIKMFIKDSKTSLHISTAKDIPMHKDTIPLPVVYKRASAPDRYDVTLDGNPFCDGKNRNHDLRPTVPVRRFSKHNSEAAKDLLEMRASFLSELQVLLSDESIHDDFDDETSTMESSVVSDITNPTFLSTGSTMESSLVSDITNPTFIATGRAESTYSIDTFSSEGYDEPLVEYHQLSSSSGSKDLPPRPAARELTASSQDFESIIESGSISSPPPMPPPPRPFAQEQHITNDSHRKEVQDKDTPPRPFSRRLTESNLTQVLSLDLDDLPSQEAIHEPPTHREQTSALTKLAIDFVQGVTVGTNYYRLKKHDNTFVGRDAVDFILNKGFACTREDAVFLGQRLQKELKLFHHVSWDHKLKDGNFLYRFTDVTKKSGLAFPRITSVELLKIAEAFEGNVKVSTHFHHFMTYTRTFVGSEAVDYLVNSGFAHCRNHAVFLGQRLLEDLKLFHHVAHAHQFKDANLFYRFSRRSDYDSSSATDDDSSFASMGSLLVALQRRSKGSNDVKPMQISVSSLRGTPLRSSLRLAGGSELKQEGRAVTFGSVNERVYERTLDMHPATRSGPSIGLGWKYEDKPTMPLSDEPTKGPSRNKKDFLLSGNTRKSLLREWGHSKMEMFLASRVNEKIREQRKRTLKQQHHGQNF